MSEPLKRGEGQDPSVVILSEGNSITNKGETEASMSKEAAMDQIQEESQELDDSEQDQKPKDEKKKSRWQRWKEAKAAEVAKAKEDAKEDGEEAGPKDGIFKNFFVCEQVIDNLTRTDYSPADSSFW